MSSRRRGARNCPAPCVPVVARGPNSRRGAMRLGRLGGAAQCGLGAPPQRIATFGALRRRDRCGDGGRAAGRGAAMQQLAEALAGGTREYFRLVGNGRQCTSTLIAGEDRHVVHRIAVTTRAQIQPRPATAAVAGAIGVGAIAERAGERPHRPHRCEIRDAVTLRRGTRAGQGIRAAQVRTCSEQWGAADARRGRLGFERRHTSGFA